MLEQADERGCYEELYVGEAVLAEAALAAATVAPQPRASSTGKPKPS